MRGLRSGVLARHRQKLSPSQSEQAGRGFCLAARVTHVTLCASSSSRLCLTRVVQLVCIERAFASSGSYVAMTTTRSKRWASNDHWLAQVSFGLVVAGIAAWLVTLYWTGPFDF